MQSTSCREQNQQEESRPQARERIPDEQSDPVSSYWFPVYEGLFEHASAIRDAVWLFMWLIARTTVEGDGRGKVLGGIPIHDARPAGELGLPVKTIRRWRLILLRGGYVKTVRTPYGFRYTLLKSKKWQKLATGEFPKREISHSENSKNGKREFPLREERIPAAVNTKKTTQGQHKEEAEEAAAAPSSNQNLKVKSNTKTPEGKSSEVSKEAWEEIGMRPTGSTKFVKAWTRFHAERPEGEKLSDTMEDCIQWCKANGINPPPPFYDAKRLVEEREKNDDSEVARVATGEYIRASSEQAWARMEAEREKEREAAMARFDALSREERVAELRARLANNEQWITGAKAGSALAGWALEQKAKLEQQIAELSSPVCQEEISLTAEEEIQLLSQFPEAWDSLIGQEPLDEECQEVAA